MYFLKKDKIDFKKNKIYMLYNLFIFIFSNELKRDNWCKLIKFIFDFLKENINKMMNL